MKNDRWRTADDMLRLVAAGVVVMAFMVRMLSFWLGYRPPGADATGEALHHAVVISALVAAACLAWIAFGGSLEKRAPGPAWLRAMVFRGPTYLVALAGIVAMCCFMVLSFV